MLFERPLCFQQLLVFSLSKCLQRGATDLEKKKNLKSDLEQLSKSPENQTNGEKAAADKI